MLLAFHSLRERGLAVQPASLFSFMAATPQKPMVIKPAELTQAGKLDAAKQRQAATGTSCRPRAHSRNAFCVLLSVRPRQPGLVGRGSVARAC